MSKPMTKERREEIRKAGVLQRDLLGVTYIKELLDEVDRLRAALDHYANPENWCLDQQHRAIVWDACEVGGPYEQRGTLLAQEALGMTDGYTKEKP